MFQASEKTYDLLIQVDQALKKDEYSYAIDLLNSIIKDNSNYAPAYRKLGALLMHTQLKNEAKHYIDKAIELSSEDSENWKVMGEWHKKNEAWFPALKAFEKAAKFHEDDGTFYEIFKLHTLLKNEKTALQVISKIVHKNPKNIIYTHDYAKILLSLGRREESLSVYRNIIDTPEGKNSMDVLNEWFKLVKELGYDKEAYDWLSKQVLTYPDNALLKLFYSRSCYGFSESEKAFDAIKDAYSLDPDNIEILWTMGRLHAIMKHPDEAYPYYLAILNKDPLNIRALDAIAMNHTYQYGDEAFRRLNVAAAYLAKLSEEQQRDLHYILAKAYEDVKDYNTAFLHYEKGGKLRNSNHKAEEEYEYLHKLSTIFFNMRANDFTEDHQYQNIRPVFIVGMPRSGTSLMEQILSNVEGVFGAGELPYLPWILNGIKIGDTKLATHPSFFNTSDVSGKERAEKYLEFINTVAPKDSMYIIDKLPHNFIFLGYIHLLFPQAKIIHMQRHPIDTCVSAYKINFTSDAQHWADDLRIAGKYYCQYNELMQYWQRILPKETLINVRYEDLVADLENVSRQVTDFVGVEWNSDCLSFHKQERAVQTASIAQVRKALYSSSINKWHSYRSHLKPLIEEVGDLAVLYEENLLKKR